MSFQGNAFQGDAFQVGSPLLYPWALTTGTSYFDGLPDRTRIIIYQGIAAAIPQTQATTTPITAGLQDVDVEHVAPFKVPHFQFSTFTTIDGIQATTPVTSGLQDLDRHIWKKPFRPPPTFDFITIDGIQATTPKTAGLQDLDRYIWKKPFLDQKFTDFITTAGIGSFNSGIQDFDRAIIKRPYLNHDHSCLIFPVVSATATPITAGLQDIDLEHIPPFKAPHFQFSTFTTIDGIIASTPVTAGLQDLDRYIGHKLYQMPQFAGFITIDGIQSTTPVTAGLQDLDQSSRKKYLQTDYLIYPINTTVAALTPITAGLQDFDYAFKKPFRPPQFTDFVTIDGIQSTTPVTAGLQDLDRYIWLKPFQPPRLNDFITIDGIQSTTPITAGLQDFERVPQKKSFAPDLPFMVPPTQQVAQATAGLQDFDIRFFSLNKVTQQQVTSNAPTFINIAITPTDFEYANAAIPPFRYGMKVTLQEFCSMCMGQNLTPPPTVPTTQSFPFIANVGTLMQRS